MSDVGTQAPWQQYASPAPAPAAGPWQQYAAPKPDPDPSPVDKLVQSSPGIKEAANPYEGFLAGLQTSATGLALHGRPNIESDPHSAGFFTGLANAAGQGIGDIPANIAGFVLGAAAGGAATSETGPGAGVGAAGGGMFTAGALPQAVRETMMDYYSDKDNPNMTSSDFLKQVALSAWTVTQAGIMSMGMPGPHGVGATPFTVNGPNVTGYAAKATAVHDAINPHVPNANDFDIQARSAAPGASEPVQSNMGTIYRQTGVTPWKQAQMGAADPALKDELLAQDVDGNPAAVKFNATRPEELEPYKTNAMKVQDEHAAEVSQITTEAHANAGVEQLLPKVAALEGSKDDAVSPRGAVGKYQIMPGVARSYGFDPEKLTDPVYNEGVARTVLADLSKRFNGDEEAILVAYNAGPSRAFQWVRDGRDTSELPNETKHYLVEAGYGGKGGEPPEPPPKALPPPEGPEGPDFSKMTAEELRARYNAHIGEKTKVEPGLWQQIKNLKYQAGGELAGLRDIDSMMAKRGMIDPSKDYTLEDMGRMVYSSPDRFDVFVHEGPRNIFFDKEDGPSVDDLEKHIRSIGGNRADFNLYQAAMRTIQKAKPTDKFPRGINTGLFDGGVPEAQAVLKRLKGVDYESANQLQRKIEVGFLKYFQDSGMLDSKGVRARAMGAANLNWTSMRRVSGDDAPFMEPTGMGGKFKVSNPLRMMEGSDKKILNPTTANLDNWRWMIKAADTNRFSTAVIKSSDMVREFGLKKVEGATLAEPGSDVFKPYGMEPEAEDAMKPFVSMDTLHGTNRFVHFEDGKREIWSAADPYIAQLIRGGDPAGQTNILLKTVYGAAKLQRAGIVGDLGLLNTVLLRHPITAALVDPLHPLPIKTTIEGFMDAWNKSPAYYDLKARGGLGGAFMDTDLIAKQIDDQSLLQKTGVFDRVRNAFQHPIQFSQSVNEFLSNANKIGYAKMAARKGLSPNKAAVMARNAYIDQVEMPTANFVRGMAKSIPFFQPAIRGTSWVVRMAVSHPKATTGILGSYVAGQVALGLLNREADKNLPDNEKFTSLSQMERDNYFITPPLGGTPVMTPDGMKISGGTRHKLIRPFVIGPLLSVITERIMQASLDNDPHAFDGFLGQTAADLIPGLIPQIALPGLEEATNHNFYSGRQLMSDKTKQMTPDLQYTAATSEVSKKLFALVGHNNIPVNDMLQKANMSPITMDNWINEYGGSLGSGLLHALDAPLRWSGLAVPGHAPDPWDTLGNTLPFVKSFVVRNPGMNTQQISNFYDDANAYENLHSDVAKEIKEGSNPAALRDKVEVGRRVQMDTKIMHSLNAMGSVLDAMDKRTDMTVDEKRQLSDRIYNDAWHFAVFGSKMLNGEQPGMNIASWESSAQTDLTQANGQ